MPSMDYLITILSLYKNPCIFIFYAKNNVSSTQSYNILEKNNFALNFLIQKPVVKEYFAQSIDERPILWLPFLKPPVFTI